MKNGLTMKFLSVMKNYIKSICVFLLLLGACASVWATDVTDVDDIVSGSTYIIKAYNGDFKCKNQ